jgi:hypothetical protein
MGRKGMKSKGKALAFGRWSHRIGRLFQRLLFFLWRILIGFVSAAHRAAGISEVDIFIEIS